jgi:uncharacterized protein (DUF697 family)
MTGDRKQENDQVELSRGFELATNDAMRGLKRPTILVWGYTGNGKSSLIRGILGPDTVPDDEVGHGGKPKSQVFKLWESDFLRVYDSRGFETGESLPAIKKKLERFIDKCQSADNVDEHIHITWYTINGAIARIQESDLKLLKVFPHGLVVVTKSDLMEPDQIASNKDVLIRGGVAEDRIFFVSKKNPESFVPLIKRTLEELPLAYKTTFRSAQLRDLDEKRSEAESIVHTASAAAAAVAGVNFIPLADALLITPIQTAMIARLGLLYGESKSTVSAAMGPMLARAAGKALAASLLDLVPLLGTLVNAGVAFAITETLGYATIQHLEKRAKAKMKGHAHPSIEDFIQPGMVLNAAKQSKLLRG